jgi:hypothetical protein
MLTGDRLNFGGALAISRHRLYSATKLKINHGPFEAMKRLERSLIHRFLSSLLLFHRLAFHRIVLCIKVPRRKPWGLEIVC